VIALAPVTADNWQAALSVRVQPSHLHFVASIEPVGLIMLAKCWVNYDGQKWHPFVLMDDDKTVGIAAVGVAGEVAWVHHVLIDVDAQGRGLGRQLMVLLAQWLRSTHPSVTRIGLNVLPANEVAWALYQSLGFVPVGRTVDDQSICMAWLDEVLS
jgi:RimJ/RimL family protein N-acetyltransferase